MLRTTAGTVSNSPNARCPTEGTASAGVWTNDFYQRSNNMKYKGIELTKKFTPNNSTAQ